MPSHRPEHYVNPFERIVQGIFDEHVQSAASDIFYQDALLTAFLNIGRPPNVPLSTLIIPNTAYETLYDMPDEVLSAIHIFSKRLAIALKTLLDCDGVSLRQHNEPAGGQDVFHYHLHVIPRFKDDWFHQEGWRWQETTVEERASYARRLRDYLSQDSKSNLPD